MHIQRHIVQYLHSWSESNDRKPLILRGARQVGKTTLIKSFAKQYAQHIFLNLERSDDRQLFSSTDDVKVIRDRLFLQHQISHGDRVLVFIDEIQESPQAIKLLRYFYEELPELHVIAAGSLLEFALGSVENFPVGRIQFLWLHPVNFGEYLQAKNPLLYEELLKIPIREAAHPLLLSEFHKYAIIGGMPEAVKNFLTSDSLVELDPIYHSIWEMYKADIPKYAANNTERDTINFILDHAAGFLDERITFANFANSGLKSREVSQAFHTLDRAKAIQLIYPVTQTVPPLTQNLRRAPRLQFLDTGLVNHMLGIQSDMLSLDDLNAAYKGAIIPHLIAQELTSTREFRNIKPAFWVREQTSASSEVDLVLVRGGLAIPIEIKSGKKGTLRSLHTYIDKTNHNLAVRMYAGRFSVEEHTTNLGNKPFKLLNLPYYLGTQLERWIDWFIENANAANANESNTPVL
ncbi:MAG: AAA family ATPase [Balneolales bacterium]|nr:AAA family ATPase [Balneolales bacterium]